MNEWRTWWDSLTPDSKSLILNIAGGVAVLLIGGAGVLFRTSIATVWRRLFRSDPPPAPPPQPIVVKIEQHQIPPSAPPVETPKPDPPAKTDAHAPASLIPRPPVVGFVARRDAQGRDILELLKEELAPQKRQLVALWGAGGVGKTTLAVEAVRVLGGVFGERVVWTGPELRADFTFSTLLDEVAAQLGRADLRPLPLEQKEGQVRALLTEAPALVVLDNFETVAKDEQPVCVRWLAQSAPCPVLVTTRQRVEGAHNVAVGAMSLEEAQEFVGRWIEREAHGPNAFEGLDRGRVIEAADRNPRVLEWVLARIDLAGEPEAVLAEVARGEGDAARRVFDGSFNLPQLGDDGRDALLALSLFVPDASREALAEASGFGEDLRRLNEALTRLASLWLVKATPGNKRLTLEGLTREMAKSRLRRDARAAEFRRRFVAFFLRYTIEHMQPTPEDYDALEAEKDNLLGAMDAAFDSEDWQSVQRMADVLASPGMLHVHGYWDEALRRNKQALEAARRSGNDREVAVFAHNSAIICQDRGELVEARRLYGESLEIARRLGDQRGIAISLHELGRLAQARGELTEARRLYGECLEIKKRLGDQREVAYSLGQLGNAAYDQGDKTEARRLYDECLEISKRLGDQSSIAISLNQLGRLAQDEGNVEEARRLYGESLEINKRLGNQYGIAETLRNLGLMAEEEGNKAEAVRLIREALSIYVKLGSPNAEMARRDLERLGKPS